MIPGSPPEFSSTAHRPEENETALQPRTLANEADFFEQAPSRILPFLKPLRQTPCNRTVVLAAVTLPPRIFTGTQKGASDENFKLKSQICCFSLSFHWALILPLWLSDLRPKRER